MKSGSSGVRNVKKIAPSAGEYQDSSAGATKNSRDVRTEFILGMKASIPIALAYFVVSIAVGLYWVQADFTPLASAIFSATSFSSTGEFAGIKIMAARSGFFELALTTILINLRYVLMSASISQRLPSEAGLPQRLLLAFGVTDEIYAVNITRPHVTVAHYLGATLWPVFGWVAGTLVGAYAGSVVPESVASAAGILLYAMFVAIVIPPVMGSSHVACVAGIAAGISVLFAYAPVLKAVAFGWRVIIATLIAAGIGATFFPHSSADTQDSQDDRSCAGGSANGGDSCVASGSDACGSGARDSLERNGDE